MVAERAGCEPEELISGDAGPVGLVGSDLVGVGVNTLEELCAMFAVIDLAGIGKAFGITVEEVQSTPPVNVLEWASKCTQLASQAALAQQETPFAPNTGGGEDPGASDAEIAQAVFVGGIFIALMGIFIALMYIGLRKTPAVEAQVDESDPTYDQRGLDDDLVGVGVTSMPSVTEI
jgi:hypothetical protein